jgi:uncharacterized protein YecT (DUF1311 family)
MLRYRFVTASALAAAGMLVMAPTVQAAPVNFAASSASPAPQPPAIKELFSPVLPCNPNTTLGQEGCAEHLVLADDKQLTQDVKVIFGLLSTSSGRRDFVSAQTSWLAYRTKDCTSQSDVYQGGTEQPVVYGNCLANDDASRRLDLKSFYVLLTQDLGSKAPAFP